MLVPEVGEPGQEGAEGEGEEDRGSGFDQRAEAFAVAVAEPAVRRRDAVARDAQYSAAWKALGGELAKAGREAEALEAYRQGIEAARKKGDRQAEKEMTVFARRLGKKKG